MAIKVSAYDTRLEGRTPVDSNAFISFQVNDDTPLSDFFDELEEIAEANNGISTLFLMTKIATSGMGGANEAGLVFCHENIQAESVPFFARLSGLVEQIVVFRCLDAPNEFDLNADVIHPELGKTFHGDGDELCRQIALYSSTRVTVVREGHSYVAEENRDSYSGYEIYFETGAIDYSDWEGSVISFDEFGIILDEVTNPISWRNSHGLINDPRLEPEP